MLTRERATALDLAARLRAGASCHALADMAESRKPMTLKLGASEIVAGRTIVVTGGTGTFGGAAVERFTRHGAREIRIVSRDEKKQDDLRRQLADKPVRFFIGDVRDRTTLVSAMHGADYVFHAAALKQVPSCEHFPLEAAKTNVFGTDNVLDAAIAAGVKRVVVLSTDKAAYPINAMGLTKALMEKVTFARAREAGKRGSVLCATRYGNVLASRGSVVPVFLEQALARRPLTVTVPEMTRFVMRIEDALDLVELAIAHAEPGDLFVHRAAAVKLGVLAEAVAGLFDGEREIKVVGRREGEKDCETLITGEEMARAHDMGDYFRIPADYAERANARPKAPGAAGTSPAAFTSDSARMLELAEMMELLRTNDVVKEALATGALA
jgi:UDP-N-acetylglucosamine 4,6-dehydratase